MLYNMQKYLSHIISFIFKQFCKINKSVSIVIPNLQMSETEALRLCKLPKGTAALEGVTSVYVHYLWFYCSFSTILALL